MKKILFLLIGCLLFSCILIPTNYRFESNVMYTMADAFSPQNEIDKQTEKEIKKALRNLNIDEVCENLQKTIDRYKEQQKTARSEDYMKLQALIDTLEELIEECRVYEESSLCHLIKKIVRNFL